MKTKDRDKKNIYRLGSLTILELMTVLAVLGILLTWILHSFFT